ncbi:MAG TPA: Fic family protein [Verrucomicrobiae bacterium]|nr:Fic family protein [Verrucomicrobiae bacterium]
MMSFRSGRIQNVSVPTGTVWLMSDIAEGKGKQELFTKQSPQVLKALREMALVQSVESSNRIEGVTVEPVRLLPLVIGHARPKDRSEQEIQGYRRALNLIHTDAANLVITPDLILRLHGIIQEGAGDAGQWKRLDNEIVEFRQGAPPTVRFRPVSAAKTPAAMDELCRLYRHAMDQQQVPPLLALGGMVLDFLCVHPFRDGNGRVSRLLTLLALYQHGYEVGRYISLERLTEESKEDYYEVLRQSSDRWHEGQHDLLPWLNYFLVVVRRAYREFEERAGQVKSPRGAKTVLVEAAINAFPGEFTVRDLERACPGVSRDMIQNRLFYLRKDGLVTCKGRGQGARWRKRGN